MLLLRGEAKAGEHEEGCAPSAPCLGVVLQEKEFRVSEDVKNELMESGGIFESRDESKGEDCQTAAVLWWVCHGARPSIKWDLGKVLSLVRGSLCEGQQGELGFACVTFPK